MSVQDKKKTTRKNYSRILLQNVYNNYNNTSAAIDNVLTEVVSTFLLPLAKYQL